MIMHFDDTNQHAPTWGERAQLTTFLEYVRDTARMKCDGISQAKRAKLPGQMKTRTGRCASRSTFP
jgi:hypothetical protein